MVKNLPVMQETWVRYLDREDTRRREWQPTPVFLPGEFHGQRRLADYSPWDRIESDKTERLTHTTPVRNGFPGLVKDLPAMLYTQVQSPGQEYPLEKGMATHSSILAWIEEPGGLQSMGSKSQTRLSN